MSWETEVMRAQRILLKHSGICQKCREAGLCRPCSSFHPFDGTVCLRSHRYMEVIFKDNPSAQGLPDPLKCLRGFAKGTIIKSTDDVFTVTMDSFVNRCWVLETWRVLLKTGLWHPWEICLAIPEPWVSGSELVADLLAQLHGILTRTQDQGTH